MRTRCVRNRRTLELVLAVSMGMSLGSVDQFHVSVTEAAPSRDEGQASDLGAKAEAHPGVCEREAERLVGHKAARIDRSARAPKKIRDVPPKYPKLPPGTVGSGMWLGEILINRSGKVAHIWSIREVQFTPPFAAFNDSITDSIRQWEYEELLIQGKPVPVCITVTVHINWQ